MFVNSITPYLDFSGRCEEALAYYKSALGAEVDTMFRFNESPDPVPEGMLPAEFENKVMHSAFRIFGIPLMATDGCDTASPFGGFYLAATLGTEAEVRKAFESLADGGNVIMPLTPTFWSPLYGQVTDRFGVSWMLMLPAPAA